AVGPLSPGGARTSLSCISQAPTTPLVPGVQTPGARDRGHPTTAPGGRYSGSARHGTEAMDGVEVDGSRGMRRDVGRGERGGALSDAVGNREGTRCVQAARDTARPRRARLAGGARAARTEG